VKPIWPKALILLAAIAAALIIALYLLTPPAAAPASTSAAEFSVERAMEDLKVIADQPRPVGSQEHAETREYIVEQIRALGLEPRVQTTTAIEPFPEVGAAVATRVNNILVRLEGTSDSRKAVMLSAHYDTFSGSTPGASDCGSCLVTLLETLRTIQAGPHLKNDVIFIFTDAEERISLGAKGFVEDDPWAEDARVILNYEGAGSHGPVMVLQTAEQNGPVIDGLLEAAPYPAVYSFLPGMWQLARGGDDMEVYKEELEAAGLDFVYFFDRSGYHTATDNLETIDPRSVQHHGSYALALTRHFGNATLEDLKAPDEVFFTVLPGVTVHYPEAWGIPQAVLLALAFLGVIAFGMRQGRFSVGKFVLGVLASLLVLIGVVVAMTLLWVLVESLNPGYEQLLIMGTMTYNGSIYLVAFVAFTVALTTAAHLWLGGKLGLPNLAAGAMLWWVVLLTLSGLYRPDIGYVFAWPLAFGLLSLCLMLLSREERANSWGGTAVLAATAFASVLILAPTIFILFNLMGMAQPGLSVPPVGLPMLFVALLVGLLLPQFALIERVSKWLVPGPAALVCLAFLGVGQLTSGFDADHPRPNAVSYELDANTGEAVWQSPGEDLDGWTSQFFPGKTEPTSYAGFLLPGLIDLDGIQGPAPTIDLPPPTVEVLDDTTIGETRTLRLRVASSRGSPNVVVWVETPGDIGAASIDGKRVGRDEVPRNRRDRLAFSYAGVQEKGFELSLTVDSSDPVEVTVQDISEGLPEVPGREIEPREPWMMPLQTQAMDPTKVTRSFVFEGKQGS